MIIDIPEIAETIHVGEFCWHDGSHFIITKFYVKLPADTSTSQARSWRENLHTLQLMMAWQQLIDKGYRNIHYISLHPHPIF